MTDTLDLGRIATRPRRRHALVGLAVLLVVGVAAGGW